MISKFNYIKSTGVFTDFDWNKSLIETNVFSKLNIFYGQNYSGKTTLSRILRSFETGKFSENYENADFELTTEDNFKLNNKNFKNHNNIIRVFNEDFVRDNLKFIIDSSENILPFAVLGEKNNEIESAISDLEKILGTKKEKNSTGLYYILQQYKNQESFYLKSLKSEEKDLNKKLSDKATGIENGIKYNAKYNQINYNIGKLKLDIEKTFSHDYEKIAINEKEDYEGLLNENLKTDIKEIIPYSINFKIIEDSVSTIVTKVVNKSDKIDELVQNAIRNSWVKDGLDLHKKEENCMFCTSKISTDRWAELEKHFDEESKNLEEQIDKVLIEIQNEQIKFKDFDIYKKDDFYIKFQNSFLNVQTEKNIYIKRYLKSLENFQNKVLDRKKDILNAKDYNYESDITFNLNQCFKDLNNLRIESNSYSKNLENDQINAREALRLNEVSVFCANNDIQNVYTKINLIKDQLFDLEQDETSLEYEINLTIEKIENFKKLLTDETKGAEKINDFLQNHFGHMQLSLQPVENEDFLGRKTLHFEIQRDKRKAYNLSEGEHSLIAFCYFIAKLDDLETKGAMPIIWIDDPISSLDGNHIFFVYSLIKSEIYDNQNFEQLFISTHNLNFLKYLKRLPTRKDTQKNKVEFYLVERIDNESTIKLMPKYLKDHITEFHHLFRNIYECSKILTVDDTNYVNFYNFSNNARKFLEIYLFYKYPNFESDDLKYKRFFDQENIPRILTSRVLNEYSHLCGVMERGETPIEVPEMKKVADLIISKLELKDKDQFDALVSSIQIVQES